MEEFAGHKLFQRICQIDTNLGRKKQRDMIDSMIQQYREPIGRKIYHAGNVIQYRLQIRSSLDFGNGTEELYQKRRIWDTQTRRKKHSQKC